MTISGCVMAIGGNEHKGFRQESILREFGYDEAGISSLKQNGVA